MLKKKEATEEVVVTPDETVEATEETTEEVTVEETEGTEEAKQLVSTVKELVESEVSKMRAELSKPTVKNINVAKAINVKSAIDRMSKEEKFKKYAIALKNHDFAGLRELQQKAAGSTTSLSEVLPPEEFVAEVFRLEEEYGVARRDADVRRVNNHTLRMILGADDLQVSIVGEAGVKPSKTLDYSPFELTFRKGVGILPLTDELIEESAIDLWRDATQRFARAFARKEDEFVFTDATSGIINQNGVNEIEVANANAVTFDELSEGMYGVPTPSMEGGKFYLHRSMLGMLQRIKDNEGRYIWMPGVEGPAAGTLWGRPYVLTEVLPSLQDIGSDEAFMIFGDLRYTVLGERTGMQITMSNQGVVEDTDGDGELNLFTQDLTAMRAVKRFNAKVKFPQAYTVYKATNPVS